eukprot:jgi/Orpsp1_1/1189756/evm.model.d7180000074199.1
MEETIIPAYDIFRPEIVVKSSPVELCWNFTTVKKNIKFGVYRSLDNGLESSKNVNISYNALNEKSFIQNDKAEFGSTSVLGGESMITSSQVDLNSNNNSSSSYSRRKSNFNDYNLEVVKKLDYYESSKSIIKGSCVLDKAGTYVLVFDNSINKNTSNRLTFLYFTRPFNLLPEISKDEELKDADNKSEILFEGYISKKKRNNKINSWVKRYVTLDKAGNLSYYKSKESTSKGLIQINSSKVNIISKRRIYIDTGAFIYRFYIRDDKVYKKFLDSLELIEKNNKKGEVMSTIRNIIYNDDSLKAIIPDANALEEVQKDFEQPLNQIHQELNNLGSIIDKYKNKKSMNMDEIEDCYENLMKSISSVDFGLNRVWKKINEEEICVAKLERTFRNCLADDNRLRAIVNEPQADISFFTDYKPEEIINDQTQKESVDKAMTASTKDDDSFYDAEEGFSSGEELNSGSDVVDGEDTSDDSEESNNVVQDLNTKINEYDVVIKRNMTFNNIKAEASKPVERRTTLPAKTIPNAGGFISIIRKNIGKDLSRVSMPVTFNEPINLLQKLCEELEYSELLKNACDETLSPSQYERLMYVGAFALS